MCMHAKSFQSCLTLWDPMDCSPLSSSVYGVLQARMLEWVATPSSRGSSPPRDWTHVSGVSCTGRWVLYHWRHLGSPADDIIHQLRLWSSLVPQTVRNPPAMWETRVWSLSWDDPLEKGTAYPLQYSCLENCMDRGPWQAIVTKRDFHFQFTFSSDGGLNPWGWDWNTAKTQSSTWDHSTLFQDLIKLRFLMSHRRKNSLRDKMIGKKWIYLERNTFHRQACRLSQRQSVASKHGVASFYRLGNCIN